MKYLDLWPVGAEVETIVPLPGHIAAGQNKQGATNWVTGIRVPAGERGRVTYHIDDGRICCQFDCDEKCGHTFGEPEKFLKLVSVPVGNVDQLRAALAAVTAERDELAAALRWIPVGERLPEAPAWVLVYADGAMNCMWYYKGEWGDATAAHNIVISDITYWRPLPPPPPTMDA